MKSLSSSIINLTADRPVFFVRVYKPHRYSQHKMWFITDRVRGNAILSVCPSVCFCSIFGTDWPLTLNFCKWVSHDIARRGLKVKVKVMDQANAVGPTSIEGSFFSSCYRGRVCLCACLSAHWLYGDVLLSNIKSNQIKSNQIYSPQVKHRML